MSGMQPSGPGSLQASTREQLLHQCQEAPVRKVPLLHRQFKQLSLATTRLANDEPDSAGCQSNGSAADTKPDALPARDARVRVMAWNILADGECIEWVHTNC